MERIIGEDVVGDEGRMNWSVLMGMHKGIESDEVDSEIGMEEGKEQLFSLNGKQVSSKIIYREIYILPD